MRPHRFVRGEGPALAEKHREREAPPRALLRNCLLGGRHELEPKRPGLRPEARFAVTPMGGFGRSQPTRLVGLAGGD